MSICDVAITRKQIHKDLLDSKFPNLNGQLVCIAIGEICQNSSRGIPADFCPFLDRYRSYQKQLNRVGSNPLLLKLYEESDMAPNLVKNNGKYTMRKA